MLADRLSALADDISHQKDVSLGVLVDTLREAAKALEIVNSDAIGLAERNIASNAALADALGLLRAAPVGRGPFNWFMARDQLLAKHGKTEEAKTP